MQSEDLFFKIHVKENAIRRSIFPWKTRKYMLCRACGAGQTPTTCYAELSPSADKDKTQERAVDLSIPAMSGRVSIPVLSQIKPKV